MYRQLSLDYCDYCDYLFGFLHAKKKTLIFFILVFEINTLGYAKPTFLILAASTYIIMTFKWNQGLIIELNLSLNPFFDPCTHVLFVVLYQKTQIWLSLNSVIICRETDVFTCSLNVIHASDIPRWWWRAAFHSVAARRLGRWERWWVMMLPQEANRVKQ